MIAGPDVYFADHVDKPGVCKLLRARERAWMLAAKLVHLHLELEVLLDRGLYVCESSTALPHKWNVPLSA